MITYQVVHETINGADLVELVEHQLDDAARLLVRIKSNFPMGQKHITHWYAMKHLAALGLIVATTVQAITHRMQLDLAHRALKSQQHPVVGLARIIDTVLVGQQRAEDGTQL